MLLLHGILVFHFSATNFLTVDEAGHIPSGLAHWVKGDLSPYRVNPPLPRMIATLPVLMMKPTLDFHRLKNNQRQRYEWLLSEDFILANGNRTFVLTRVARFAGIIWSVIAGVIIFRWSKEVFGYRASLLAVALWSVEPSVIAHAGLVTPDMPSTASVLVASYAFWKCQKKPSSINAFGVGIVLGIAQLTKCSNLVLYPMWWLVLAIKCLHVGFSKTFWLYCKFGMILTVVSILVLNAGYGFSGSMESLGTYRFKSQFMTGGQKSDNRFANSLLRSVPTLLPKDYILGIDTQRADFEIGLPSYLRGEWQNRGWWYYYLYAMGVKLPVGILILAVVRCVDYFRYDEDQGASVFLLLSAGSIVGFISSQTGFNHHMRYILPAWPFLLIVVSGFLGSTRNASLPRLGLAILCLLATGFSSLRYYPHNLSYFNEIVGGPTYGDRHLVDSNIDWGQDLLELKKWQDLHPEVGVLNLAYFNNRLDPRIFGVQFRLPPTVNDGLFRGDPRHQQKFRIREGYYAISINFYRGMPFIAPDGEGGYRYVVPEEYAYFRKWKPVARAGYSILIFHVTASHTASAAAASTCEHCDPS